MKDNSHVWPIIIMLLTTSWMLGTYLGRSTAGVTGSDPYAYTQMAVDLAQRGTLLHEFPLSIVAYQLHLAVWPTVHVGYHLPPVDRIEAASVWPPGAAILLALGYRLAGERGLLWMTPLVGLLAVMMAGLLMDELFAHHPFSKRIWLSALTMVILATSYRQVELTVTPMSDIPAQFFATLAVWASVRATRRASWLWGIMAGAALGISCFVRYTQLFMVAPILVTAYWFRARSDGLRVAWGWLLPLGAAFVVVDLPLFWYHQVAFGSPFIAASAKELDYFALTNALPVIGILLKELFRTNEFLYLLPFLVGGVWLIWQRERSILGLWATWLLILLLFHLPYAALHLRGVFSIMPVLAGIVAYGMHAWVHDGIQYWKSLAHHPRKPIYILIIAIPLLLFLMRTRLTLLLPFGREFNTFGYLNLDERKAFADIAQLVPLNGVIGCSLNSGAVDLYANRTTFRPASWNEQSFNEFLRAMHSTNRPVYLLIDGDEMQMPLRWAQHRAGLTQLWAARLPFFSPDGVSSPSVVTLWQVNLIR